MINRILTRYGRSSAFIAAKGYGFGNANSVPTAYGTVWRGLPLNGQSVGRPIRLFRKYAGLAGDEDTVFGVGFSEPF